MQSWKDYCDKGIFISSFLIALLLGVAFGNIFEGLPMDSAGYHGSLLGLLNPYGLLTGVLFVLLFAEHGALYAGVKTAGALSGTSLSVAGKIWPALTGTAVVFLVYTAYATGLYGNYLKAPAALIVPLVAVTALISIRILLVRGAPLKAFTASCITIFFITLTGVVGLFPNLIPSSLDPAYSLTIYNSSSSSLTLGIMAGVALVFVPIVVAYKIWVYRIFSSRVHVEETGVGY